MKSIRLFYFFALITLFSCDNSQKEAQNCLEKAKQELARGNYSEAKLQIDSIRTLYPKAFEIRKEGIKLMLKIDLEEQKRNISYLDSMMVVKKNKLDSIKGEFTLEKDEEYQETGNYFYPSQVVEKSAGRSFLRGQVNELGEMTLTSIYCSAGAINHNSIRVVNGDLYAETPSSKDIYVTNYLGKHIEKVDYQAGQDGGVINFIISNNDNNLKLIFEGGKTFITQIPQQDRVAILKLSELSRVLSGIEQIKKERKEAELKINFVKRKMQEEQ